MKKFKIKQKDSIRIELGEYSTTIVVGVLHGKMFISVRDSGVRSNSCPKKADVTILEGGQSGEAIFDGVKVTFHIEDRIGSAKYNTTFFFYDDVEGVFIDKLTAGNKKTEDKEWGEVNDGSWMGGGHSAIY